MIIEQEKIDKSTAVLTLSGRLDTANAPLLERKIKQWDKEVTELILDFSELTYISSMGLRVLLQAKKTLHAEGCKMIIKNMPDTVREVFEMTGFLNLMVHEEKFVVVRKEEQETIVLSLNGQMELEHIPMLSKELFEIRKQSLPKESPELLEHGPKAAGPVTVVLDMEKLTHISSNVPKHLSQTITDTKWEGRTFKIRNASREIRALLESEGMKKLLEA